MPGIRYLILTISPMKRQHDVLDLVNWQRDDMIFSRSDDSLVIYNKKNNTYVSVEGFFKSIFLTRFTDLILSDLMMDMPMPCMT